MRVKRITAGIASATAALLAGAALAAPAQAAPAGSLAEVLGVGSDAGYDRNFYDFDILREAAEVVLASKSDTPVAVLADGSAAVTAFIPNDRAFQLLEYSLTGTWERSEEAVFNGIVEAAGTLGNAVDIVEEILLYHVFPDGAVDSGTVLGLKRAPVEDRTLTMANGRDVTLRVYSSNPRRPFVVLQDQDPNAFNPILVRSQLDIRAGDQIAHGISGVLRPLDLPRAGR